MLTPKAELVDGELVLPGGEKAIQRGERTLNGGREIAREVSREHDVDIEIETKLLSGYPPDAITDHAESTDVSRIYVGHRGRSEDRDRLPSGRGPETVPGSFRGSGIR